MAESVSNPLTIQTSENRPYPFLSDEMRSSDRPSPFLTEDKLPKDKLSPFLAEEYTATNARSPLSYRTEEDENTSRTASLPKDNSSIIAELKREPKKYNLTASDIANKYGISFLQARDIYIAINQDANGIVKEWNLPDNSAVSYLV